MKCRDAFVSPCSAAYRPIFEQSSGEYVAFFLRFACLGAGPASSVSLVKLAILLLASTRASFGSDGVDPEEDRLVVGVEQTCRGSGIAQQKLNLDDIADEMFACF